MATIKLKNGDVETVFDRPDLLDAIEMHMGYDAKRLFEEYLDELDATISELEADNEALKAELEEMKDDL